jgi:chromosome segregation ATPase
LTLLFRLLQRIPAVRRLQDERDSLRADQGSMQLKLRAASAEMGVLEEQCRVLRREQDQLAEAKARQAAEHEAQIDKALLANAALLKERDALAEERRALMAHKAAAQDERDQIARTLDELRRPRPVEAAG